ncbi:MAG: hypothetical protein IJZ00_04680 [Lachnospiraceae bacterium]|nr:hypothetical protein [Lachnospiraceae bacterium]
MKRKNILIAFFVVIFLVACGNNEETVSAETSFTEEVVSDEGEVVEAEADDAEIEETITEPERVQPDASITDWEDFYPFVSSLNLQEPVLLYYYDDEYKIIYNGDDYIVHDTVGDGYFLTNFELWTAKEIYEITTNVDVELNDNYYTQFSDDGIYYYGWGQCRFRALVPVEQDLIINIRYTDGTEEEFVAHLIPEVFYQDTQTGESTVETAEISENEQVELDIYYPDPNEFYDYVESLEFDKPVILLWSTERSDIIYDGDTFQWDQQNEALIVYSPDEVVNYGGIGIRVSKPYSFNGEEEWVYADYVENCESSEFLIRLEYSDGTMVDFSASYVIEGETESEGLEVPNDSSFTSVGEYLETVSVLSNTMPNTDLQSFIDYINSFDITETAIIFNDINDAKYMIYNDYPCVIGYHMPTFYVYCPEKEIVEGYVLDESREELQGSFECYEGIFSFYVYDYYDGDIYINVEYSDGTTEELVVHFVDLYNQ